MKKKIKPVVWIAGAVAAVGIVGSAATGGSNEAAGKKIETPPPVVSHEPSVTPDVVKPSESPEIVLPEEPSPPPVVVVTYVASAESDKCHVENCRFVNNILGENVIYFYSKDEALSAGYAACGTCKPW